MMVERSCDRVFTITRRQAGRLRLEIGRNGYVLTSEDIWMRLMIFSERDIL